MVSGVVVWEIEKGVNIGDIKISGCTSAVGHMRHIGICYHPESS